jgi:hypothetical protein
MYQMIICEVNTLGTEIGTKIEVLTLYCRFVWYYRQRIVHTIDIIDLVDPKVKESSNKIFKDGWANYDIEITKKFKKILIIEDASSSLYICVRELINFVILFLKIHITLLLKTWALLMS